MIDYIGGLPDEYRTGIETLDRQHEHIIRRLVELEDEFSQPTPNLGLISIALGQIKEYSGYHFWFEERLMDEVGCPVREENIRQHADFSRRLNDFFVIVGSENYASPETYLAYVELVRFLQSWVQNHICTLDCKIREYAHLLGANYVDRYSRQPAH